MSKFNKRVAIYFGYEGNNNNPNGDPANENKPRQYNGKEVLTTDVSSKRDDRDYLIGLNTNAVFLKQDFNEDEKLMTMKELISQALAKTSMSHIEKVKYFLNRFIDIRYFGAAFTGNEKTDKTSLKESITGPIQKSFGISLNYPNVEKVKITAVFRAEKAEKVESSDDEGGGRGGAMGDKYICDYYYIHQDIIVNPKSLETWGVDFTEDDFNVFERTQWCAIKDDITHSKLDREPLLMIEILFKDDDFYFLPMKYVKSKKQKDVAKIEDLGIDFSELVKKINNEKSNIEKIRYKTNSKINNLFKNEFLNIIDIKNKEEIKFISSDDVKKVLESYEKFKK